MDRSVGKLAAVAAVLVVGLGVAACGSDDSPATSSSSSSSETSAPESATTSAPSSSSSAKPSTSTAKPAAPSTTNAERPPAAHAESDKPEPPADTPRDVPIVGAVKSSYTAGDTQFVVTDGDPAEAERKLVAAGFKKGEVNAEADSVEYIGHGWSVTVLKAFGGSLGYNITKTS